MSIDNDDQLKRAVEELEVLEGVIGYADRMISEEGGGSPYRALRRQAYGKTVVIETERSEVLIFRLSATSVIYPNAKSGYATPHSPVGRLCGYLGLGDTDESPRWGEYTVKEVRLFDRFDGPQFEPNVRNFLHMNVAAEHGKGTVSDLRAFLAGARVKSKPATTRNQGEESLPATGRKLDKEAKPLEAQEVLKPVEISVDMVTVIDDELSDDVSFVEMDDSDVDEVQTVQATQDYFGLSETFFLNRTREQDNVMSRSPIGPMFVQGVAGSGKTSAALGRTKMLCDFNANAVFDEAEFREIAGHTLAYWSGKYAGQFSQEGSVGFVRTGELIQYLKQTCLRLDLPNLPVKEYPELRSNLRQIRKIERSRPGTARWTGLAKHRDSHAETTMAWLTAADKAIAMQYANAMISWIPDARKICSAFSSDAQPRAIRVATFAAKALKLQIEDLVADLKRAATGGAFKLDRLAARVERCIQQVRKAVLSKDVLWASMGPKSWIAANEQELAQKLVTDQAQLYLRSTAQLVFLSKSGPLDATLTLLTATGDPVVWGDSTRQLVDKGLIFVRNSDGRTLPARASDANDLFLRLLPEATEKVYAFRDGALRPFSIQRGLGRERLGIVPSSIATKGDDDGESYEPENENDEAEESRKQRSVDSAFNSAVHKALLQPLSYLADTYADALASDGNSFPEPSIAKVVAHQLDGRKLVDEDIDLLLCLAHIIGRGYNGKNRGISETPMYQAVFVDEVQDFTEQQVYLMVEQARPEYRAITVVGDLAQKLHNGNEIDIRACFPNDVLPTVELAENLRQLDAPGLAWFSACFRAEFQDGGMSIEPSKLQLERMQEKPDGIGGPELIIVDDSTEIVAKVVATLLAVRPQHTAAVLLPDRVLAADFYAKCKDARATHLVDAELSEKIDLSRRHVRHFTSVANSKGLEFDVVIVPYLEKYMLTNATHINSLYVALTRPRKRLILMSGSGRQESRFDSVMELYHEGVLEV